MTQNLLDLLGIELPIIQAPMAGTSSPALAAAVANAGGLGSVGVGATNATGAKAMITEIRERTNRSFNVNVFCHRPAQPDGAIEKAWIDRLRPEFTALGAEPPAALTEIYKSFIDDDDMLAVLLAEKPKVVSFHFGLPPADRIQALRDAGIILLGSAINPREGEVLAAAGLHAVVGQGYEAGGHRGAFDENDEDAHLGTMTLTRLLVRTLDIPVIAAGGIMDGAGIAAALTLGASAAQLGTAFIGCPESLADEAYRKTLMSAAAHRTTMTRVISGRPARSLANRFTALGADIPAEAVPCYPMTYDLGKALNAAGKAKGDYGFGAQWAGQGAPLARAMPAAELVALLVEEMKTAISSRGD